MPAEPTNPDRTDPDAAAGDWRATQREFNRSRADGRDEAAPHRRRVTTELCRGQAGGRSPRLTLLGVGPGLDCDFPALLETFAAVAAADLDASSLAEGLARQGVADDPRVRAVGGDDLMPLPGDADDTAAVMAACAGHRLPGALAGAADVAGSLCLLSQLVDRVAGRVGPADRRLPGFAAAVRSGHLRSLADALRPGGVALLVTDLFSDATCPALRSAADADAPALVERELARGNVFHGVHPAALLRTLREDPGLAPRVVRAQCLKPWVWRTPNRAFAVTAVRFRLGGGGPAPPSE